MLRRPAIATRRAAARRAVRICALAAAVLLVVTAAAPAAGAAPNFDDDDYWAFVERSMAGLDVWWQPDREAYLADGDASIRVNANMLSIHAIAASSGHRGLARQDERARVLVKRLLSAPAWRGVGARASSESVCWSGAYLRTSDGHAAIDPQVGEALAWAWRARDALGLDARTVKRLVAAVDACARHKYWSFPPAVANQINWNTQLYAAAATVTGRSDLLRGRYRRLLTWFVDGISRPSSGARVTNFGTGYAFHYLPYSTVTDPANTDVPEYANIVVAFIQSYDQAVRGGMRPLPSRPMTRLRAWVRRLLAGSWTHAGFLNWDTGLGAKRWMSGQYWTFAHQGLLAIAASPSFRSATDGKWAKAMFDSSLVLYRRLADEAGEPLAPPRLYDVHSAMENRSAYAVRLPLDAARAVALGLGELPSQQPPPLYAFDPDTGRLAVTTPRYSTAIVPDNRGAFPYGGIELARLYGPGQRVAANVGGVPPAAFGVLVDGSGGRRLLASQATRAQPLEILRSPRGRLHKPSAYPATPYAGPFKVLEARGKAARNDVGVVTTHRFTSTSIRTRWDVDCRRAACERVTVTFPTWGAGAAIDVVRADGSTVDLTAEKAPSIALADVRRIEIDGRDGGYDVEPKHVPAGATLTLLATRPQATNPHPGPTLGVALAGNLRGRRLHLDLAVVPHA